MDGQQALDQTRLDRTGSDWTSTGVHAVPPAAPPTAHYHSGSLIAIQVQACTKNRTKRSRFLPKINNVFNNNCADFGFICQCCRSPMLVLGGVSSFRIPK
eukprot:1192221-Prorocentrum_minimum.AAC.1